MNKLLVIIGPTASGKTALGLMLAEKFNGEILSSDSRQVYKHMDIGTGKNTTHFQWGIDLVEPDEPFSASQYVEYGQKVLKDIRQRGKLPIVVGGTGLYIKELLEPSQTLHIQPDEKLRARLQNCSISQLQNKLQKADKDKWERMNESDRKNPRRLIRAIEVALMSSRTCFGISGECQNIARTSREMLKRVQHDTLIIGLTAPYEFLYKRIDQRVEERINMGMEKERESLSKYSKLPDTIGYHGETDQKWKFAEHAYARRQMSYFKSKFPETVWFDISENGFQEKIVGTVSRWYS